VVGNWGSNLARSWFVGREQRAWDVQVRPGRRGCGPSSSKNGYGQGTRRLPMAGVCSEKKKFLAQCRRPIVLKTSEP